MNRKIGALTLLLVIAVLAIAGCGGGDSTSGNGGYSYGGKGGSASSETAESTSGRGSSYSTPTAAPNAEEGTTFVSLGNVPGLGMILVDSNGNTLYDFHKDKGTKSSCYGACAQAWPPLLSDGEPEPSNGAMANMLGTTKRTDGTVQVTYAGHPLYTYTADTKPGEANGNDVSAFGAEWYSLTASGKEPE